MKDLDKSLQQYSIVLTAIETARKSIEPVKFCSASVRFNIDFTIAIFLEHGIRASNVYDRCTNPDMSMLTLTVESSNEAKQIHDDLDEKLPIPQTCTEEGCESCQ